MNYINHVDVNSILSEEDQYYLSTREKLKAVLSHMAVQSESVARRLKEELTDTDLSNPKLAEAVIKNQTAQAYQTGYSNAVQVIEQFLKSQVSK